MLPSPWSATITLERYHHLGVYHHLGALPSPQGATITLERYHHLGALPSPRSAADDRRREDGRRHHVAGVRPHRRLPTLVTALITYVDDRLLPQGGVVSVTSRDLSNFGNPSYLRKK